MPAPTLTTTGERLYESVDPLVRDVDEQNAWTAAHFIASLVAMADQVADLVSDQEDGTPGYALLFDPDTVPAVYLAWLARSAGAALTAQMDDGAARIEISDPPNRKRGTVPVIKAVVTALLPVDATLFFTERHGSAYRLTIATLVSETPDPGAITNALAENVIPGGIVHRYDAITGTDYLSLRDTHRAYSTVAGVFIDYADVQTDPVKQ